MYPNGGAWLATHLWTHYLFSKDEAFLREWYPVIKGTADFYLDYLQTDPRNGYLVVVPSVSPEHGPMGKKSPITAGCTMDT
jgi:alpha-L-fucosidase 2